MPATKTKTKIQYQVAQSQGAMDEWRVERIDYESEGEVSVAIFSGPKAKERANEYAPFKNGQR
ncbi:MAG: hypothetical protein HYS09_03815 [Chloroflexi bacterium]|nr:hypothetical protein [Chloroflexota bacterium]